MWNWGSKLRGRPNPWQMFSNGLSQIYTRVLGTIVVSPPQPKILTLLASLDSPIACGASAGQSYTLFASVSSPIALGASQ